MNTLEIVAASATASFVFAVSLHFIRPPKRLAGRTRPYALGSMTAGGRGDKVQAAPTTMRSHAASSPWSVLTRLLGPPLGSLSAAVAKRLDGSSDARWNQRLDQARLMLDLPPTQRVAEFRAQQGVGAVVGALGASLVGVALGRGTPFALTLVALGATAGAMRPAARVLSSIEDRRTQMRIELYTVNQLIALHIRAGGGVIQALQRVTERGNGAVIDELRDVVRACQAGTATHEALGRAAQKTAEPQVARTYRLLATGARFGTDLAASLLAHSDEVRDARRDAIRRAATKRRAGMLLPIIGILAPVMLLFIAAPIPSLVFAR